MQAAFSRAALRRLGIAGTLALRPALTAASALSVSPVPAWPRPRRPGAHETLTNSVFRSAYELLYTPLPESEKRRVKAFVDVTVDKLGALVGSGTVALALAIAPAAAPRSSSPPPPLVARHPWPLAALHRGYVQTLELSLLAGECDSTPTRSWIRPPNSPSRAPT